MRSLMLVWVVTLAVVTGPGGSVAFSQEAMTDSSTSDVDSTLAVGRAEAEQGYDSLVVEHIARAIDLVELTSTTPGEALEFTSGADLVALGSFGLPQSLPLRGSRAGETVYLLDGIPISDYGLGGFDLNWLPLACLSEVAVDRGGLSSQYGSGSTGGAVHLKSADALVDVPRSRVGAWWGDFGSRMIGLDLRRSVATRFGVFGAYENLKSGGWRAGASFEGEKIYGKVSCKAGERTRFHVTGFRYKGDVGLPDSCPALEETQVGLQKDRRDFLGISLSHGDRGRVRAVFYHIDTQQMSASGESSQSGDSRLDGVELGIGLGSPGRRSAHLAAGMRRREIESSRLGARSLNDAYGSVRGAIHLARLTVMGSLRLEKSSHSKIEVGPSVHAVYTLDERLIGYARLDRSFTLPSFGDLYWRGPDEDTDPDVGPEYSLGFETGASIERGPAAVNATFFWRDVKDMIVTKTDEFCRASRSTDSEARITGLEVTVGLSYGPTLQTSISYAISTAEDESGRDLEYVPSKVFKWMVRTRRAVSPHVSVGLTFAGRWVSDLSAGRRFLPCSDDGTCLEHATLPAFSSGLLYGYVGIDHVRVFSRVRNVFDDDIYMRWGLPRLPSRSYEFGVSWGLRD